jgi:hypothetical protein
MDTEQPIVRTFESNLISGYNPMTSSDLRSLADTLDERKIESIELRAESYYDSATLLCEERRLETEDEARIRYNDQINRQKSAKHYQEQEIERLAKELGYKISK